MHPALGVSELRIAKKLGEGGGGMLDDGRGLRKGWGGCRCICDRPPSPAPSRHPRTKLSQTAGQSSAGKLSW